MEYIDIREEDILLAIEEMDAHSTVGLDGFPEILLKSCKRALADPFQNPFQSYVADGRLPSRLKGVITCSLLKR